MTDDTGMTAASPPAVGDQDGPVATGAAPRLYEQAREILAAGIERGAISPGEQLSVAEVARRFGISRSPARQALSALEGRGLVVRAGRTGYRVSARDRPAATSVKDAAPVSSALSPGRSWERIYREVETALVARMAFGSWHVVENDLAKFYGVSRTVARDVLARLQQRGIVRKDRRSRWYVPGLGRTYVAELYEMRAVLEPVALVDAAKVAPPPVIARLSRHLEEAIADADALDAAALDSLETELHVTFLGYGQNRTLIQALGSYQSLLAAHSYLYRTAPRLYPTEPFLPEHLAVAERLAAGRVDEAGIALAGHLRQSLERALNRIDVVRRDVTPGVLPYVELLPEGWDTTD
jgi:DNA-binding GntR family transcriptional regulator